MKRATLRWGAAAEGADGGVGGRGIGGTGVTAPGSIRAVFGDVDSPAGEVEAAEIEGGNADGLAGGGAAGREGGIAISGAAAPKLLGTKSRPLQ